MSEATTGALEESWKRTIEYLETAKSRLSLPLQEDFERGTLGRYIEYLSFNELELALDELIGLGELNKAPVEYWRDLEVAARNMELSGHVVRIGDKILNFHTG